MATVTLTPREMHKYIRQMIKNGYDCNDSVPYYAKSDQNSRQIWFIDKNTGKTVETWSMTRFGPIMWKLNLNDD